MIERQLRSCMKRPADYALNSLGAAQTRLDSATRRGPDVVRRVAQTLRLPVAILVIVASSAVNWTED